MAESGGMGNLQWSATFYLMNRGVEREDEFLRGPFFTPIELVIWRGRFLNRLFLLHPILSSTFILRLIEQEVRDYSYNEKMLLPGNPEALAQDYLEKYIIGHA